MQLAQAIDAWVHAHKASLSASTERDIAEIRAAVVEVGWGELPSIEVDRGIRLDILEVAVQRCALSETAIGEFLKVIINWANDQDPVDSSVDDGLGPRGAFYNEDVVDDDSEEPEESDDDSDSDDWDDDDSDDDWDDDWEDDDSDDDWDDDDDDDEEDRATGHDSDDWIGYLTGGDDGDSLKALAPENEQAQIAPAEKAAASSFFDTIGASPPPGPDDAVLVLDDETTSHGAAALGGAFSAAADEAGAKRAGGIDWITVAYFTVAAICFALVIYFYLSS